MDMDFWDKMFKNESNLKRHMRYKHTDLALKELT